MARISKAIARAALWHALRYRGEKLTQRKPHEEPKPCDRDLLNDGMAVGVEVVIAGKVGPLVIEEPLVGSLTVGHAGMTTKPDSVPTADLVAWLLARHGEEDAALAVATLTEHYKAHRSLPEVSKTSLEVATTLLAKLKTPKRYTTRGPVKLIMPAA